jgi:hypothetical protein
MAHEPLSAAEARSRAEAVLGTDDTWPVTFALRGLPWLSVSPAGTWGVQSDPPAPPRFLHSFDSAYLAHADKSRIVAPEHENAVYRMRNATMRPIFLVDGFVAGTWKLERTKTKATLVLEPFAPLPLSARRDFEDEGERLVRFVADDAPAHVVRWS